MLSKKKAPKDWAGYENENFKVHKRTTYDQVAKKWFWLVECKHCGSKSDRRARQVLTSKSCGCIRSEPANKGKRVSEDIDAVRGYWLMRKPWKEGVQLQVKA